MEIEFHRGRRRRQLGRGDGVAQPSLLEGMEERPKTSQQIWFAFLFTFSTTLPPSHSLTALSETLFLPPSLFVRRVYE